MSAKSRLSNTARHRLEFVPPPRLDATNSPNQLLHQFIAPRLQRWYLLMVAMPGYVLISHILFNVAPQDIEHTLFSYSYLPLSISFFWASFFTLTIITLQTRRSFFFTILLTILLLLKLQRVVLNTWLAIAIFSTICAFEFVGFFMRKAK